MGLETGTYLNDLVTTNPDGATDAKSEGDNHIRLIKSTLKATFPGMAGAAWRVQTKAADYALAATDNMTSVTVTAAATITGTASTLGNGFTAVIYNAHSAAITVLGASLPSGNGALYISNGTGWLIFPFAVGNVPAVTSLTASGNITSTAGTVQTSAGSVNANKNSQTSYSTAGLQSISTSGNTGLGLHCSGASAAYIEHARGGNGITIKDSTGTAANVYCNYTIANENVYAAQSYTSYCYLGGDSTNSLLAFDNTDYMAYNRSANTLAWVFSGTSYLVASASGFYPQTDNTLGIGVASNKWLTGYITTLNYDNLVDFSDKRFKTHIAVLDGAWSGPLIDRLHPVRYTWTESGREDIGFYAQDVAEVLPEAAMPPREDDDTWGLQPDKLIPLLVAEIQALRRRVAELESR